MAKQALRLLVLFVITLSFCGCSKQYQSERILYKATKLARTILISPEAVAPQEFERTAGLYRTIFEKYADTQSARRARIALGGLYLSKKEYEEARGIFKKVLELYPDDKGACIEAHFAIGKSYESEDMWPKAVTEYRKIMDGYAETEMALSLPMYIASKDNNYDSAILYYTKLTKEYPQSELGFRAENFIVMCYVKKEDWLQAEKGLEKLVMDYPMAKNLALSLRMIANISTQRLNNPDTARTFFKSFLEKHPEHPLKEYLEKGLEAIENVSIEK
ncbi:MAG: tetratricopeptide repeat protein [Candidatus Omnitrophica bacterium]|nr:tetratricopeptide repeat protein [Candidatus Omnitrophota bacterium]MBU1933362.1 tetratricopeptide repeat protein [Candidatus Omnitrophota bacterium]